MGCCWAELGRRTAGCLKQPAVPIASSRPRRNRPTLPKTKTIIQLVSSWAEISTGTTDCPWQSTMPEANSRPRRSRQPHLLGEIDPRPPRQASTRKLMRDPERSGGRGAMSPPRSDRRCAVDLSVDSAERTTRQHLHALCPSKPWTCREGQDQLAPEWRPLGWIGPWELSALLGWIGWRSRQRRSRLSGRA